MHKRFRNTSAYGTLNTVAERLYVGSNAGTNINFRIRNTEYNSRTPLHRPECRVLNSFQRRKTMRNHLTFNDYWQDDTLNVLSSGLSQSSVVKDSALPVDTRWGIQHDPWWNFQRLACMIMRSELDRKQIFDMSNTERTIEGKLQCPWLRTCTIMCSELDSPPQEARPRAPRRGASGPERRLMKLAAASAPRWQSTTRILRPITDSIF